MNWDIFLPRLVSSWGSCIIKPLLWFSSFLQKLGDQQAAPGTQLGCSALAAQGEPQGKEQGEVTLGVGGAGKQ